MIYLHKTAPTEPDRSRADLKAAITSRAWRHSSAPVSNFRGGHRQAGPSCCRENYNFHFNPYSEATALAVSQPADIFSSILQYSLQTWLGFSEESGLVSICLLLFLKSAKLWHPHLSIWSGQDGKTQELICCRVRDYPSINWQKAVCSSAPSVKSFRQNLFSNLRDGLRSSATSCFGIQEVVKIMIA